MFYRTFLFFLKIIMITYLSALPALHADQGTPAAFLESSSFDFGQEYEGNEVIHDFVIKNNGLADLEIKNVHSG